MRTLIAIVTTACGVGAPFLFHRGGPERQEVVERPRVQYECRDESRRIEYRAFDRGECRQAEPCRVVERDDCRRTECRASEHDGRWDRRDNYACRVETCRPRDRYRR